ncbi:MAG TPA: heme-binding protein [Usitatibacter sp.]|nr:heme-binding protein [Usitatibacter sp.]
MRADLRWLLIPAALALAACGGGGGNGGSAGASAPSTSAASLDVGDVQRIVAQAVAESQARGAAAHVVVVDRVGNVLAAFRMPGAPDSVAISSGLGVHGGLDGIARGTIPASLAAIAKAVTAAYLSSNGNAFSTRTANQIIQEHFDPQEAHQPGGPLYGVQFSQLTCSDIMRNQPQHGTIGPKRSPLGLAADPGGLPLYKNGVLVGGVGVEADGLYTIDRDITDLDDDLEEHIAVAGTSGYAAPADIRAERITADGRTFRFVDSEQLVSDPSHAPAFGSLAGSLEGIEGYIAPGAIVAGTAFGSASSGVRPDDGAFAAASGWIIADAANANRYPPRGAVDGTLAAPDVQSLLAGALDIAHRARAQIRRPLGSSAELSIAVVDLDGNVLGLVRTADAPIFGIDVAVQKARTALFFSHPQAASQLRAAPDAVYVGGGTSSIARYADAMQSFLGSPAVLQGAIAWTPRAIANLHRPYFPDGIEGTGPGPLSTPIGSWSPFNVGFQLDLVNNQLVKGIGGDLSEGCAGRLPAGVTTIAADTGIARLRNGVQVFPGGAPIYRPGDRALIGAIGVSGDGVDQDDMVSLLGVGQWSNAAHANAPADMRADTLAPQGVRLRYAQCPQAPFNGSTVSDACAGL